MKETFLANRWDPARGRTLCVRREYTLNGTPGFQHSHTGLFTFTCTRGCFLGGGGNPSLTRAVRHHPTTACSVKWPLHVKVYGSCLQELTKSTRPVARTLPLVKPFRFFRGGNALVPFFCLFVFM